MGADNDDTSNKFFEEHEKYGHGPLDKRSCTDVLCLIVFVAFFAVWGFVGKYTYDNSKLTNLHIPTDSSGLRCGHDANVIDQPYLADLDIEKCFTHSISLFGCATKKVCVAKCPTITYFHQDVVSSKFDLETIKANIVCLINKSQIKNQNDLKINIEKGNCAKLTIKSTSVFKRCFPVPTAIDGVIDQFFSNSTINDTIMGKIKTISRTISSDVIKSSKMIYTSTMLSVVAAIIFICMLRWLAKPVVWGTLFGMAVLLVFCVHGTWSKYFELKDIPESNKIEQFPSTIVELLSLKPLQSKNFWLTLSITTSVIAAILFLVFLVLRNRINLAICLVKEGSKAVSSSITTIFFPLIPWILQSGVLFVSVWLYLALGTIGEEQFKITNYDPTECVCTNTSSALYYQGAQCTVQAFEKNCYDSAALALHSSRVACQTTQCHVAEIKQPVVITYYKAITLLGFYWGICFASAFGQMVLASTFATWYWTMKKADVPTLALLTGLMRTVRYHLGTIAFGSLLLAICKFARAVLSYIETQLKLYNNGVTRALLYMLRCFFWCLEKFLKFFNDNVYIVTAIKGTSFCVSATEAFGLLSRNVLRVLALTNVTGFLFFLSKLLVSLGMGASVYQYTITHSDDWDLTYNVVPATVVTVATYMICHVFFAVYSVAVDTIFICFLIDSEMNDGTPEKKFFMSKSLMSILGKKNKDAKRQSLVSITD